MFVALVIQSEMRMRLIAICAMHDSTLFCSHFLINGTIFEKKKLLNTKYVFRFSLQLLSETCLIIWRAERDMIKNAHRSSWKYVLFLSYFNKSYIFLRRFSKNTDPYHFLKIRPVGAELIHADGQTDRQTWRSEQSLFALLRKRLKA